MGDVNYWISGSKKRKKIRKNISKVFGDERSKRILKNIFRNHSRNVLELIKYPQLDQEKIAPHLEFKHKEIIDKESEKGRGLVLMTAHFGAKQFLQIALGLNGFNMTQVNYHMGRHELTAVQKKISQKNRKRIEKSMPINFISAKSFLRPIFRLLDNGEIIIIAGDGTGQKRHMDKSFVEFEFLGKSVLFPTNIVPLARKAKVKIIPVFVVRQKSKHIIIFEKPLDIKEKSRTVAVRQYVELLEGYIRNYPSQWEFWEEFDEDNLVVRDISMQS